MYLNILRIAFKIDIMGGIIAQLISNNNLPINNDIRAFIYMDLLSNR